jgi:hypothetical protein
VKGRCDQEVSVQKIEKSSCVDQLHQFKSTALRCEDELVIDQLWALERREALKPIREQDGRGVVC